MPGIVIAIRKKNKNIVINKGIKNKRLTPPLRKINKNNIVTVKARKPTIKVIFLK